MIKINNVTKKFGKVTAVRDLNLEIEKGAVFGLVGSNGGGKSTLLRMIAGVIDADYGLISIDGQKSFENTYIKSRCVFVSDFPFFYNNSTLENLSNLYRDIYPTWSEQEYLRLCSMFPIKKRDKIITMSKGMQRQAALILALATQPEYLLLDEIFDGLDPVVRQLLKKLLMESVSERNMTVVIASHNLRELEDICDHVGFLHRGGILLEHNLDDLKLGICKVQIAFNREVESDIFKNFKIVSQKRNGNLFNLVIKGDKDQIISDLQALLPVFMESLPLTLEEVFISEMEGAGYDINNIL